MTLAIFPRTQRLRCVSCGTTQAAACDCGVEYVPAVVAAAAFAERHPEMSNVAIAKELGVDEKTVRTGRARNNSEGSQPTETKENKTQIPPKEDYYFQRLARPPSQTLKLIMGMINNLDPDQREALFVKIRKRWKL